MARFIWGNNKNNGLPVFVFIKQTSAIKENEKDTGDEKYNKYDKMERLDKFREKVKSDDNTVDFFTDISSLRYASSSTFNNAINYADENSGWVRYRDIVDIINEKVEEENKTNSKLGEHQQKILEDMIAMLSQFCSRLTDLENNQITWEKIPTVTKEDIDRLFQVDNETLIISNPKIKN